MTDTQRLSKRGMALGAATLVLAAATAPAYASNGHPKDPKGNNGTMKVDGPAYDDGLGNEPHVTCEFRLKMYGFDDGQTADISIAGHAPSGSGTVSEKNDVLISDDAAGGGPNDVDAVVAYTQADLDLTGLTPHPKQGYHLKVTLRTDAPGGVKHKVFWLEPCAEQPVAGTGGETVTPGAGGTSAPTVGAVTTPVAPETGTESRTAVLGMALGRESARENVPTEVVGTTLERRALASTGSPLAGLLTALGALLVVSGALLVAAGTTTRSRAAAPR